MPQNHQWSISRSPWLCFCVALWKAGCPRYETKVTIATTNSISHLPAHSFLPVWRASPDSAGGVPTTLQLNSRLGRKGRESAGIGNQGRNDICKITEAQRVGNAEEFTELGSKTTDKEGFTAPWLSSSYLRILITSTISSQTSNTWSISCNHRQFYILVIFITN